jgi:glycosyltransferase involved in cell wall biosynthesis
VTGAKVFLNETNRHFVRGCNQAAKHATGDYVLFLNNDAQLLPGSLETAVATIERDERVGVVGGRIICLDGTLQEAGSIVWNNGSCLGYGRGDNPYAPAYMFRRDVDYCSAVFLLTRRRLFEQLGGFDEDFIPAYYEDSDYCLRLRQQGYRTVYEPAARVNHFEFGSSSHEGAMALMAKNLRIFKEKHADRLARHLPPDLDNVLVARHADYTAPRILFIDDRIPHPFLGAGHPRANIILWIFVRLGAMVTFYPTVASDESWAEVYADVPRETEFIIGANRETLSAFLRERAGYYDTIFVSRPHNMETLSATYHEVPDLFPGVRIIYDAEAIFALRELARERLLGQSVSTDREQQIVQAELSLADIAHDIVVVSEAEKLYFLEQGFPRVHVLGHALAAAPTLAEFADRQNVLFVGAIHGELSPNEDSVEWFVRDIFPRIRSALGDEQFEFHVVGYNTSKTIANLACTDVKIVGRVESLIPYFDKARIFVAPTRFAAGLPIKIYDAAAHGVPIVATQLVADQLGWEANEELLIAETNDPEAFAAECVRLYSDRELWQRLRANAIKRIETECSLQAFENALGKILGDVMLEERGIRSV